MTGDMPQWTPAPGRTGRGRGTREDKAPPKDPQQGLRAPSQPRPIFFGEVILQKGIVAVALLGSVLVGWGSQRKAIRAMRSLDA